MAKKKKKGLKFTKSVYLVVIAIIGILLLYLVNDKFNSSDVRGTSTSNNTSKKITSWKTTKSLGIYSLNYPSGWHVGSFWPEMENQPITIFIDPEPVSNAPRGCPCAAITIQDYGVGEKTADQILAERRSTMKSNYERVRETRVKTNVGTAYRYVGKFPKEEYLGGTTIEKYIIKIEGPDDINDHVLTFEIVNRTDLSSALSYMVKNLKKNY